MICGGVVDGSLLTSSDQLTGSRGNPRCWYAFAVCRLEWAVVPGFRIDQPRGVGFEVGL